jgi:hypothetical protein
VAIIIAVAIAGKEILTALLRSIVCQFELFIPSILSMNNITFFIGRMQVGYSNH